MTVERVMGVVGAFIDLVVQTVGLAGGPGLSWERLLVLRFAGAAEEPPRLTAISSAFEYKK